MRFAFCFDHSLHRGPHIAQSSARFDRRDPGMKRSLSNLEETSGFVVDLSHRNGDCGIAEVAIDNRAEVNRNYVPTLKNALG